MSRTMGWLALLFILVPAVELAILVEIGGAIGTGWTFGLIVLTGMVGAALAKHQGLGVLKRLREDTQTGQWPGAAIADGAIILVAGALLLTPGVLTDAVGFACLLPVVRGQIRAGLRRRLERAVQEGQVVHAGFYTDVSPGDRRPPGPPAHGPVIDVTSRSDLPPR